MPIYNNLCTDCNNIFESIQTITDKEKAVCDKCNSNNTERTLCFNGSIIFEGTGWTPLNYPKPMQRYTRYI